MNNYTQYITMMYDIYYIYIYQKRTNKNKVKVLFKLGIGSLFQTNQSRTEAQQDLGATL